MHKPPRLFPNSRKSPHRLAVCTAGLILLIASGMASAAPEDDSVRGVSAIARVSATIVNPASLRAAELENIGTSFDQTSGLTVAPAAVIRRDCDDERTQERCNLIILDLP